MTQIEELTEAQQLGYITGQAADGRVNVELETDDGMVLNMGPQHPATHGTLRLVARLDGEQVTSADVVCGYMHRGYEKLCEVRSYPQVTTLVNRIDWLGSFANEVPFILAAERLMEVEAPPRAQWIRTILFEMSRIANISLFLGDMGAQVGAITPVFFAFRDRERALNLIEMVTGGRFHPNFDRIGGLKEDLPKGWVDETKAVMVRIREFCDEMDERFPTYGFARHKGYGTRSHYAALIREGPCAWHRRSFAPIRMLLAGTQLPLDLEFADLPLVDEDAFEPNDN